MEEKTESEITQPGKEPKKQENLPIEARSKTLEAKYFPEFSHLPPENREVFQSLFDLLVVGFQRDKVYSQLIERANDLPSPWRYNPDRLFFGDVREDLKSFGEFWNPQTGIVEEGQVFATTREGWAKGLPAPSMKGIYREGQAQIELKGNFDAGNPYEDQVLPGVGTIILRQDGSINKVSTPGKQEPPSSLEKGRLVKVFNQLGQRVQRIHEHEKRLLEKLSKSSQKNRSIVKI